VTEIRVRNCTVRVIRRNGWSWGPDPRRLLDDVLAAVPALIAEALAAGVPEGIDVVIREPVRITVPLRRPELAALTAAGRRDRGAPSSAAAATRLSVAVREALAERGVAASAPAPIEATTSAVRPTPPVESTTTAVRPTAPAPPPGPAILALLAGWREDHRLAGLLELLPEPVLTAWHRALIEGWRAPTARVTASAELAEEVAEAAAHPIAAPGGDHAAWLRRRLLVLTVVADRTGLAPCQPAVLAAVDYQLGPPPARPTPAAAPDTAPTPAAVPPPSTRPAPETATQVQAPLQAVSGSPTRRTRDIRINSALPFLILTPLARTGWLETLAVAVEAAELADHWSTVATALAFKVLSPPEQGWRRSPEDCATAAAFAGIDTPFAESALPGDPSLVAAPLDAVLGRLLVDGHPAGAPLVMLRPGERDGLVLFDGAGLVPMAWADDAAGLAGWLHECPDARVIVDAGLPTPERPDDGDLLRRARLVLTELRRRPAFPLATKPALERSLTLGAGAALATIAWTLWRDREPTDPLLALDRLASLDARVRDDGDRVRVAVPLGGRYFDLQRHGLLGEVPEVPWLGGRTVEIVGG
jgi:hypothetical protein